MKAIKTLLLLFGVAVGSIYANAETVLDHTFNLLPERASTAHSLRADKIILKDKQTIVIENLYYDGTGK